MLAERCPGRQYNQTQAGTYNFSGKLYITCMSNLCSTFAYDARYTNWPQKTGNGHALATAILDRELKYILLYPYSLRGNGTKIQIFRSRRASPVKKPVPKRECRPGNCFNGRTDANLEYYPTKIGPRCGNNGSTEINTFQIPLPLQL